MRPLRASRRQSGPRRDPAPSRVAYKLHRLWLTPVFRRALRTGLPVFAAALALGLYVSDADRRARIGEWVEEVKLSIRERPEFMVKMMAVDGATPVVAGAVREMLPLRFPQSSFNLDLAAMRTEIETIDAVRRVELRIRAGGVLQIDIEERVPAILWRTVYGIEMLDAEGFRVASLRARRARTDLPLIAGAGAEDEVPEALELMSLAGPIRDRVRGLVRVGERRWDLVLDRGQRIQLPAKGAAQAVQRVIALDQSEDMLARDLTVVDMRLETRPTITLAPNATEEFRRIKEIETRVMGQ